jgi:hypothetical protein
MHLKHTEKIIISPPPPQIISKSDIFYQYKQRYMVFTVQAYQTSQYVVPHDGIFLGKWRSSFICTLFSMY